MGQVPTAPGVIALRAGLNDPQDASIAVLEFLPESINVRTGTTVGWCLMGPEPHIVTFLPLCQQPPRPDQAEPFFVPTPSGGPYDGTALVNSGHQPLEPNPATFQVTFARPGEYSYVCTIHPQMTDKVTVTDEDGHADSQEEVTRRGDQKLQQWLQEGRAAKQRLMSRPPCRAANLGGSAPSAGRWWPPPSASIRWPSPPAHDGAGGRPGDLRQQLGGAPHGHRPGRAHRPGDRLARGRAGCPRAIPPDAERPGLLQHWPTAPRPRPCAVSPSWSPSQGRHTYICLLHVPGGMVGTIQAQ